jgi:hypothetical protein
VKASKVSLFPRIYEVDAVGIGATKREFLIPYLTIYFLRESQSYMVAYFPHISN